MKLTYTDDLNPSLKATLIHIAEVSLAIWRDYRWQVRTMRQARRIAAGYRAGSAIPQSDALYMMAMVSALLLAVGGAGYIVAVLAGWLR